MSPALPTLSLVTPSFNQARFLGATFASVFRQQYPALEYVVIDGGSTDGSRDIIAGEASRLAFWSSEPDGGMYDALNKGFARTQGEIMGWLNSDDLLAPGALRAVGEIFARFPEVEWLSSLALGTWSENETCIGYSSIEGFSREAFLDGGYLPGAARHYGWIPQESTFWRRSLWEKAGARLDPTFALAGDFELWARFFEHAELVGTPTPLGGFRTHAGQKSRDMSGYLAEARRALAQARQRQHHAGSRIRRLLLGSRLAGVPGARGPLGARFGYPARRVVAGADGAWQMCAYSFL
jgi:glycosyltransferase involved in cell wall biosynthesis